MKVLVASDFYYEYELYETDDLPEFVELTRQAVNSNEAIAIDGTKHKLIGGQEIFDTEEAKAMADVTLFTSDFYEG